MKQRRGAQMTVLQDWTASPAIKRQQGADAMQNDFRIVAGAQTVAFLVNGTEVASLPRAQVSPDGVFGLRFSHAVNAHVVKVARGSRAGSGVDLWSAAASGVGAAPRRVILELGLAGRRSGRNG